MSINFDAFAGLAAANNGVSKSIILNEELNTPITEDNVWDFAFIDNSNFTDFGKTEMQWLTEHPAYSFAEMAYTGELLKNKSIDEINQYIKNATGINANVVHNGEENVIYATKLAYKAIMAEDLTPAKIDAYLAELGGHEGDVFDFEDAYDALSNSQKTQVFSDSAPVSPETSVTPTQPDTTFTKQMFQSFM